MCTTLLLAALSAALARPNPMISSEVFDDVDAEPTGAAEAEDPEARPTLDDTFSLARINQIALSPDGRWVVWGESRWSERADGRLSDLWRVSTGGGAPERLTFDDGWEGAVTFSEDGASLYFLKGGQVHRMAAEGGPSTAITQVEGGIQSFALAAGAIWYSVGAERPREDDFAGLRGQHGALQYGHAAASTTAIHRLDLQTWRSEEVYSGDRAIYAMAPSPDGQRIATLSAPDRALIWREGPSEVQIIELGGEGEVYDLPDALWRDEAPSPYGWLGGLVWRQDGGRLAFDVSFDGHSAQAFVARFEDGAHAETSEIPMEDPWHFEGQAAWWPGSDRLCFVVGDTARRRLICRDDDGLGAAEVMTPEDDATVWSWAAGRRGAAMVRSTAEHFGELYWHQGRRVTQLTESNPQIADWSKPQLQRVRWTAPDGVEVEGILELPAGWTAADGPLPTIVQIHGGPTSATGYHRSTGREIFSARGWAVLSPNYRGSTGYGDAFLVELVGRENDVEVEDILAGVDHLVDAGIADPERMAVMGWSNGGYLTNCIISQTDRFKAASSGAGVFDQTMQWAIEDTPGHVINYMEGLPWEQPQEVQDASPLFSAGAIVTPTLIHVGEYDPRVPAAHSRALFRALSFYLDVPTELIVYPGAGHGLGKRSHRVAKSAWDIAWFDHYVLGEGAAPDEPAPDEPAPDEPAPE